MEHSSKTFFKQIREVYSTVMGPDHGIIPLQSRLESRIEDSYNKELKENKSSYSQEDTSDLKIDLAALKFAEFLSRQDSRLYDFRTDTQTKTHAAAAIIKDFPTFGAYNFAYMKTQYGHLHVPNYSKEKDIKDHYKENFSRIMEENRSMDKTTLKENICKTADNLYSIMNMRDVTVPEDVDSIMKKLLLRSTELHENFEFSNPILATSNPLRSDTLTTESNDLSKPLSAIDVTKVDQLKGNGLSKE